MHWGEVRVHLRRQVHSKVWSLDVARQRQRGGDVLHSAEAEGVRDLFVSLHSVVCVRVFAEDIAVVLRSVRGNH